MERHWFRKKSHFAMKRFGSSMRWVFLSYLNCFILQNCKRNFFLAQRSHDQQQNVTTGGNYKDDDKMVQLVFIMFIISLKCHNCKIKPVEPSGCWLGDSCDVKKSISIEVLQNKPTKNTPRDFSTILLKNKFFWIWRFSSVQMTFSQKLCGSSIVSNFHFRFFTV